MTGDADRERADAERIIRAEREFRDAEADVYDATRASDPYKRAIEETWAHRALSLQGDEVVLDAGCGTGQHLDALLGSAARVIAVDHSPKSVELAAERVPEGDRHRVSFDVADLRALPVDDAGVDAILCVEVIQHIPGQATRLQALRELHRVLRPRGTAVLIAYRWLGHVRRRREAHFDSGLYRYAFTVREMRGMLREAGFERPRVGAIVAAPRLTARLGVSVERQCRLAGNVLARPFTHYVAARATRA